MSREDFEGLAFNLEEADSRIVFHARDATVRGYHQVNVWCPDTDFLILLQAHREYFLSKHMDVSWDF